jgi:hypothetical protein
VAREESAAMRYRVRPQENGGLGDWLVGLVGQVVELGIALVFVLLLLWIVLRAMGGL